MSMFGCRAKQANHLSDRVGVISPSDSQQIMVNALDAVVARVDDENMYVGTRFNRLAAQRHSELTPNSTPMERWVTIYARAKTELLSGNTDLSCQLFQQAEAEIHDRTEILKPTSLNQFYFDMGMAFLRYGETQNCCQQNLPDSCVFPFREHTIHTDPVGSTEAIKWFRVVLKRTQAGEAIHLSARWLLNVAHMTLGQYPDSVAAEYLIPGLADDDQSIEFPEFTNVARQAGVATFSLAGGAIADDFDNDGNIDLVVSSFDPREPLRVFWNRGDGTFLPSEEPNLKQIRGGLNLVQTDFNNDGMLDIFVMRGGWLGGAGKHPNSLLQNLGSRKFIDVSVRSGLETGESFPTQAAAWADFDLDGDLDVYIGNEASSGFDAPSQLFENHGDGTFLEIAKRMGVENNSFAKAVTWGDYDNDGDPDLYVSNYGAANRLYRNDRTSFTDVATSLDVSSPSESFPTWFFDANNDGHLDLYVSAYSGGIAELSAALLNKPFAPEALPRLFMGQGNGTFANESQQRGINFPTHPMGANFADLDNDGYLDVYMGTGWPDLHELMPNMLYRGGETQFTDVTSKARVGHLQKGHAVAMADFDNDGDLDLFEQMGGFVPADRYYDVLYQNPITDTKWIKLKLIGKQSNRAAIGAKIEVHLTSGGIQRTIHRYVNSGGSFGANPLEQHIGLGQADQIESITIRWPSSNSIQTLTAPEPNTRQRIDEP